MTFFPLFRSEKVTGALFLGVSVFRQRLLVLLLWVFVLGLKFMVGLLFRGFFVFARRFLLGLLRGLVLGVFHLSSKLRASGFSSSARGSCWVYCSGFLSFVDGSCWVYSLEFSFSARGSCWV